MNKIDIAKINTVWVYKRTHVGDPSIEGLFGHSDCMGSLRDNKFDAVIGIGGLGDEAQSYDMNNKINWVGIIPHIYSKEKGHRACTYEFEHFVLFENVGPAIKDFAPLLYNHMYREKHVRQIKNGITPEEFEEVLGIIKWSLSEEAQSLFEQYKLNPKTYKGTSSKEECADDCKEQAYCRSTVKEKVSTSCC